MADSRFPLAFLVGAVGLAGGVALLYMNREKPTAVIAPPAETSKPSPAPEAKPDPIPATQKESVVDGPQDPEAALANAGVGLAAVNPAELLSKIGAALEAGDFETLGKLIGRDALDEATRKRLAQMAAGRQVKLRRPDAVQEVGEIELNNRARWALWLDGAETGRDRIFFDLKRDAGKWSVQSLTLPPAPGEPIPKAVLVDSLGIADAFLQAALRQEFELAKGFVDPTVSDAKIAGLCILFEEGNYRLRPEKPLRAVFQKPDTAGYLARVVTATDTDAAEFSMVMRKPENGGHWRVSDINLDQLLADYASRVAGGDVYYSPLVKNPKGGDTLVLYFGFNEDMLAPRTQRQLEIVAQILKTDAGKQLTISGHTDALGTEPYNEKLSGRRAGIVKDFLVKTGVREDQIITVARGQSQPRRPNFTETGADNPEGRRANRRTEIYLDFD